MFPAGGIFTGSCWKRSKIRVLIPPCKELPGQTQCTNSSLLITEASSISDRYLWQLGLPAWKSFSSLLTFKSQQLVSIIRQLCLEQDRASLYVFSSPLSPTSQLSKAFYFFSLLCLLDDENSNCSGERDGSSAAIQSDCCCNGTPRCNVKEDTRKEAEIDETCFLARVANSGNGTA